MPTLITSMTEDEFKAFLKQIVREVLDETLPFIKSDLPDILDIKQASDFLKLKIPTLYSKVSNRTIPHFKKSKRLYFNKIELQNWVQDGRVQTTSELKTLGQNFIKRNKV